MESPLVDSDDIPNLMACPQCDALYRAKAPPPGERAVCARCHTVLAAPRKRAGTAIVALAVAVVILVGAAAFLPFLSISVIGLGNAVSIFDAVIVFTGGELALLAIAMAVLVLIIPVVRALLVIYVLVPLVLDRPPAKYAARAFRWSERLRPWSMAEIFAIGCAVALVKLTDLANVEFGPAFWMFAGVVVVIVLQDRFMCRWSVWNALDRK
ncbi:MAG: paraquat-inducible protein A [Pseudomonadota bacterium]